MTTVSALRLDCRQTRDAVNALADFLLERRDVPTTHATVLRDDLDLALSRIGEVERAIDKRPQIGLLMPIGVAANSLVGALGGARDGHLLGLFAGGAVRLPVVTGLVAAHDVTTDLGLSARVRLTHDGTGATSGRAADAVGRMMGPGGDTSRRASESGVRLDILSLADVITLLARAFFSHVKTQGASPSVADIRAAIETTERRDVAAGTQSGLAAHQVRAIRTFLDQRFRDHPRLGVLAASGYWDAFASLAPRVSAEGRRRLAALLWGNLGDFDVIYSELAGALDRLNHASDVMAPPDVVRASSSASSGWGNAHPYSVLAAHTVLSDDDAAGEPVDVRTRFGQPIAIARNILAVLTREVTLTVDADPTAMLAGADLVQFPVICPEVVPRGPASPPPASLHAGGPDRSSSAPWLARALLQAKSLYLFESAVDRLDLSGLVVHLDEAQSLPAQFAPVLATWIETTHGHTPQAREASDTTLFVAVDAPAAATPLVPLETFLGASHLASWLDRWGTESAFDNLYILMADRRVSRALAATPRTTGTAVATRERLTDADTTARWLKHVRDASVAVDEALHAGDGGIAYLAQSVAAVDYARARRHQLSGVLTNLRADLSDTIDRLLYASAPDAELDWRHSAGLALQARLRTAAGDQKLGHLIADLCPSERDCAWLFESLARPSDRMPDEDRLLSRLADLDRRDGSADQKLAARFASRVLADWIVGMRLITRAVVSPGSYTLPPAALGTLVEELAVAGVRADLEGKIAAGVLRTLARPGRATSTGPSAASAAAAKIASDAIGAFVSQLGFDTPWSSRHPRRRGTLGALLFERTAAVTPEDLATMQSSRITQQFNADWIEGVGLMIEENVTQARGTRFEETAFRELAELRALLGASSRERSL